MTIHPPNRIISAHEMSHIISEIQELPHPMVWEEVYAELQDVGFFAGEIEQIHREWKLTVPPEPERTPITQDVDAFGDASFTVVPNFDPGTTDEQGINLEIRHQFIEHPGHVASLLVSAGEAQEIVTALRRGIAQTLGLDPDRPEPTVSLAASLVGPDPLEWGEIYAAVADAVVVDAGSVREALATMVLALAEATGQDIRCVGHDITADALVLDGELER